MVYNQGGKNSFVALKNITLQIKPNNLVILKGVSGSGKSTLLSLIGTFLKPTSGMIEVDNEQVSRLPDIYASQFRLKKLGFVFQSFNLFENLSVEDNVSLVLIPLNLTQEQIKTKVAKALSLANISHKKDQIVSSLSGGEKQKCAIARALVNNPKILLFDEPTANLDKQNSLKFIQILQNLKKEGKTIIVATHDVLFDNINFIDQIYHIQDGDIIE